MQKQANFLIGGISTLLRPHSVVEVGSNLRHLHVSVVVLIVLFKNYIDGLSNLLVTSNHLKLFIWIKKPLPSLSEKNDLQFTKR